MRGKKYRVLKDNYLIEHESLVPRKNQNVFMGSGTGMSALKNVEKRTRMVLKNPTIAQKSPSYYGNDEPVNLNLARRSGTAPEKGHHK